MGYLDKGYSCPMCRENIDSISGEKSCERKLREEGGHLNGYFDTQ